MLGIGGIVRVYLQGFDADVVEVNHAARTCVTIAGSRKYNVLLLEKVDLNRYFSYFL